jgi:hypothetical protein
MKGKVKASTVVARSWKKSFRQGGDEEKRKASILEGLQIQGGCFERRGREIGERNFPWHFRSTEMFGRSGLCRMVRTIQGLASDSGRDRRLSSARLSEQCADPQMRQIRPPIATDLFSPKMQFFQDPPRTLEKAESEVKKQNGQRRNSVSQMPESVVGIG